jgi:excisionase family DNA binding protein
MQTETIPRATEWLDVGEAASEIGAGTRTIRAAIQRGELQACAINGRGDLRINREWLRDWMTQRTVRG